MKILINGAAISGIPLSIFLLRADPSHNITIVERSPSLRTAGQQIDLRAQGIAVIKKLGLLDTIKARTVTESALAFVDAQGNHKAVLGKNDSGKGQQAFTSEYEIMRGDLVDVLYQESLKVGENAERKDRGGWLRYVFGTYATELRQDDSGVHVTFSDGKIDRFDLVIGADGQGSRTRRMAFGDDSEETVIFKSLGAYVAFFSIPRTDADDDMAKIFNMPEFRTFTMRTGDRPITQVYLSILTDSKELQDSANKSVHEQKAVWMKLYDDCAWQRERLLQGIAGTEDFYAAHIGQVKMDTWSKGRVALVGDAGYCPSAFTGMGTTASLAGAYVLAGELTRHGCDISAALESYNEVLRPFVDGFQKLIPGTPAIVHPKTEWGIWFLHTFLGVATMLKIDRAVNKLLPEDKGGRKIPEYSELNLD